MLSTREGDLDAKIFRLILKDVRDEVSEDDEQDHRIEIGDINACSKAGSFFPVYDRETDLIAAFIEILEPFATEGPTDEGWCYFADDICSDQKPKLDFYNEPDKIPAGLAEEISASLRRVLASARLAMEQQKVAPKGRVPSSLSTEQLRVAADMALDLVHDRYGCEGEEGLARVPAGAGPEAEQFRAALLADPSLMIALIGGESAFDTRLRAYLSTRFLQQAEETIRDVEDWERRRKVPRDADNVVMIGSTGKPDGNQMGDCKDQR